MSILEKKLYNFLLQLQLVHFKSNAMASDLYQTFISTHYPIMLLIHLKNREYNKLSASLHKMQAM